MLAGYGASNPSNNQCTTETYISSHLTGGTRSRCSSQYLSGSKDLVNGNNAYYFTTPQGDEKGPLKISIMHTYYVRRCIILKLQTKKVAFSASKGSARHTGLHDRQRIHKVIDKVFQLSVAFCVITYRCIIRGSVHTY